MNRAARVASGEIPILQGYLFKLKTGLLGGWQKRWFRIEGDKLMYYKDKDDLEHLGWVDLSECKIVNEVPSVSEPFTFALETPGRKYILRALKREHFNTWLECLGMWTGKFKAEKQVSHFGRLGGSKIPPASEANNGNGNNNNNNNNGGSGGVNNNNADGSSRVSSVINEGDNSVDDPDDPFSIPVDSSGVTPGGPGGLSRGHQQALQQLQQILEKVLNQETQLNTCMKKLEKFKQRAFVLQELLEYQRDTVADPGRRINAIMKHYTSLEKSILELTGEANAALSSAQPATTTSTPAVVVAAAPTKSVVPGQQEAEIRMRLVVQQAEQQLQQEKKARRQLEEQLFRAEVMAMKMNELLGGRDVNGVDVALWWTKCKLEGVQSSEYATWIRAQFVKLEEASKK